MISESLIIFIFAGSVFDQKIIEYFYQQNTRILLLSPAKNISDANPELLTVQLEQFSHAEDPEMDFIHWIEKQNLKDLLSGFSIIHGTDEVNEANLFALPEFSNSIIDQLTFTFRAFRLLNSVMREYGCNIIFPLYSDVLSYVGENIATISNHAKNAFMMTLSKETCGYNIFVNSLVIPHLAKNDIERKKVRRTLRGSVFGVRPTVHTHEQLFCHIHNMLTTNKIMTGQCITLRPATGIGL
jgi:hypothetical protein